MTFIVFGKPVPKGRPRFCRRGKFVQTYTPKTTLDYEKKTAQSYLAAGGTLYPENIPLHVRIDIYLPYPSDARKAEKQDMHDGLIRPIRKKGDIDNFCKTVLDGLIGTAYKDDVQIVSLTAKKWYSDVPRVEVSIEDVTA